MDSTLLLFSLFISIAVIIASIAVGSILQYGSNRILRKSVDVGLFWKLFSGLLILISSYAIGVTYGVTLLLPIPIMIALLCSNLPDDITKELIPPRYSLVFLTLCIFLNFVFFAIGFSSFDAHTMKYVTGDLNIYYRIAERLNRFGIESNNLDPIYSAKSPSVYHYGDLWLYALTARINANPSIVFITSFTVLGSTFSLGIYKYCAIKFRLFLEKRNALLFVLLFSGLFSGFAFFFPSFLLHSDVYTSSVLNYPKILIPASLFVSALLIIQSKKWSGLIYLSGIAACSFINIVPALLMAIFLFWTISAICKSISWKNWFLWNAGMVVLSVGYIFMFYALSATGQRSSSSGIGASWIDIQYIKTAIKIFIGAWLQLSTLIPFFIVLLLGAFFCGFRNIRFAFENLGSDILFLFLLLFSGISCWAILHPITVEAVQFYSNILFSVSAICISLIVCCTLLIFRNKGIIIGTLSLLSLCIINNSTYKFSLSSFDKIEWKKLNIFLNENKDQHVFAGIRSLSNYHSLFDKNTMGFIPLTIISYVWPDYNNLSLNSPFIPVDEKSIYKEEERKILDSATFSIYYTQAQKLSSKTTEEVTYQFLKKHNISILTVGIDTNLSYPLQQYVVDSMVLKNSQLILYRLNF